MPDNLSCLSCVIVCSSMMSLVYSLFVYLLYYSFQFVCLFDCSFIYVNESFLNPEYFHEPEAGLAVSLSDQGAIYPDCSAEYL